MSKLKPYVRILSYVHHIIGSMFVIQTMVIFKRSAYVAVEGINVKKQSVDAVLENKRTRVIIQELIHNP